MRNRTTTGNDRPHELEPRGAVYLRSVVEAIALLAAVAKDERDQQSLDEHEDREHEDRDEEVAVADPLGVRRLRRDRRESPVVARVRPARAIAARSSEHTACKELARTGCHSMNVLEGASREPASGCPPMSSRPFEVFVNGVQQEEGSDFRVDGRTLVFDRELKSEGKLGFWRWLSMWVGVAGTYRQNDSVDVAYQRGGKPVVATKLPLEPLG